MSARGAIRRLIVDAFPWVERLGLTASGGFEVKSATGRINVSCEDDGPPAHRVGDLGDAGKLTSPAPGLLQYTSADGNTTWTITLTSAAPGSPVVIAILPLPFGGEAGRFMSKATSGSELVRIG